VGNLTEKCRWDGAVEDEIALEQLHFLDSLPPPNSRLGLWIVMILLRVGLRAVWALRIQYWSLIVVFVVWSWGVLFVGRVVIQLVTLIRVGGVWLCVVLVVMFFRGNCVVLACITVSDVWRGRPGIVWAIEVLYRILPHSMLGQAFMVEGDNCD
jgi:hypothetical protein